MGLPREVVLLDLLSCNSTQVRCDMRSTSRDDVHRRAGELVDVNVSVRNTYANGMVNSPGEQHKNLLLARLTAGITSWDERSRQSRMSIRF